MGRMVPKG
jgi:hypothetical protein